MSDARVVLLAVAAFAGSLVPYGVAPAVPVAMAVAAFLARRELLMVVAVALLCSALAYRSWAGLEPSPMVSVSGTAQVVTDPVRTGSGTAAVVRIDGKRSLASGWGGAGAQLGRASAGDRISVSGTFRPFNGSNERRAALHIGQRISLSSVETKAGPNALYGAANTIRHAIERGSASLSVERRALFTGLVYGDDRGQSPLTEADFRLAGLTHLLAVSGQNVAYVLVIAGPLIQRGSLRARWVSTLVILVLFATITRFEPSVLRATVMAGLAVTGDLVGKEANSGRLLSLAVTALLIVDPLLASTVAFRLSVAASAGIVWLRPRIADWLAGPDWLVDPISVTIAAQLAVAPILVGTFGPISPVSVPANVLAGPVAGLTMTWGMTAGVLAGWLPPPWAAHMHGVTKALLWVLETIAREAASIKIAPIGLVWLTAAVFAAVLMASAPRASPARLIAAGLLMGPLLLALVSGPESGSHVVGFDSTVEVGAQQTTLVIGAERSVLALLDDLAAHNIRTIDTIRVRTKSASHIADQLQRRVSVGRIEHLGEVEDRAG